MDPSLSISSAFLAALSFSSKCLAAIVASWAAFYSCKLANSYPTINLRRKAMCKVVFQR